MPVRRGIGGAPSRKGGRVTRILVTRLACFRLLNHVQEQRYRYHRGLDVRYKRRTLIPQTPIRNGLLWLRGCVFSLSHAAQVHPNPTLTCCYPKSLVRISLSQATQVIRVLPAWVSCSKLVAGRHWHLRNPGCAMACEIASAESER